jgi:hypothetical protein
VDGRVGARGPERHQARLIPPQYAQRERPRRATSDRLTI